VIQGISSIARGQGKTVLIKIPQCGILSQYLFIAAENAGEDGMDKNWLESTRKPQRKER
jgi:hypothetical protein